MLRATLLAACAAATLGKRAGNTLMPRREEDKTTLDKTTRLVQFANPPEAEEAVKASIVQLNPPINPDEDALPELRNLRRMQGMHNDVIYTDPSEMEKYMRSVDPKLNASLVKEKAAETKDPTAFQKWCEEDFKAGSRVTDYHNYKYDGPISNRTVVFNLGSYKTGSTSVDVAVKKLGMTSCKVGWGNGPGKSAAFDGGAIREYQKCAINTPEAPCPGPEANPVRNAQFTCDVLGDAPWPFAWPTTMRAFPNAKFILSRQKTCKDWQYHVRGLWNAGSGHSTSSTCWYDGPGPQYRGPDFWHDRCVETERAIVMTAQKLKLPLLVLHAEGPHADGKMEDLAKFLGKTVKEGMQYPHVKTPSAHWEKNDKPPPNDEPDPNEDLWGDWSGGVPTGSFAWAKDMKLTVDPNKKTAAVASKEKVAEVKAEIVSAKSLKAKSDPRKTSAEKAAGMNADELCPGHPHILRTSASCHEEPARDVKRLATKKEEPDPDEPAWLQSYKQP